MKLSNNPYITSLFSAMLTGIFVAFVIIASIKYITAPRVPLYNAHEPSSVLLEKTIDGNVDREETIVSSVSITKNVPISAQAYIVITLDPNTVLASTSDLERDGERALPIASLTKLATAVVAENLLNQDMPVIMTKKIFSTYPVNDPGGFRLGEEIKVGKLLYPLLIVSSNNAAEALAQSYTLGRSWFIKAMNDWAYSIGAYNTYFADPSGLSAENISSAHDLAIMLAWIYIHRPELITITTTKLKNLGSHTWINPMQLLNLSSYLGGKNGYLPQAGETSASLFEVASTSKKYVVVTLNSQHRDQDILNLLSQIK